MLFDEIMNTRTIVRKKGFSLIVTVTMMILLSLIAVGLLSLSSVTLRSSQEVVFLSQARSNAKLALILAIGEMQAVAGADTRITAPADSAAGVADASRQLMGVWRSWEGLNHNSSTGEPQVPPYELKLESGELSDRESDGRFLRWMVSSGLLNEAATPPDIVSPSDGDNRVTLLGSQMGGDFEQVHVDTTEIMDEEGEVSGSIAWWVQGNNSKALIQYDTSEPETPEEWSQRLASFSFPNGDEFGVENVKEIERLVSFNTMGFLRGVNSLEHMEDYHELTSFSQGLLTNAATGGWKRDLSLFSEKYADEERSAWGSALSDVGLGTFNLGLGEKHETGLRSANNGYLYPWVSSENICMTWASLADYASLYKKMKTSSEGSSVSPYFEITSFDRITGNVSSSGDEFQSHDQYTIVEPVLSRVQFTVGYASDELEGTGSSSRGGGNNFRPLIAVKPVTVFFNPYNVAIDSKTFVSEEMLFTGETESGRNDQSWPFRFKATLKGVEYDVTRTRQFLGARNVNGLRLQTWFNKLDAMFEAELFDDINFRWKPGESKVMGVAERELENGGGALTVPNNITRIHTGYDTDAAFSSYLDSTTANGYSIQDFRANSPPSLTGSDTIAVEIVYSDKSSARQLNLPVTFNRTDGSLQDAVREPNFIPTRREITTVYNGSTLTETMPLPQLDPSPPLSQIDFESDPISPFLTFSLGLRNLVDTTVKTKGYMNHKQVLPLNFTLENIADTDVSHSVYEWNFKALSGSSGPNSFADAPNFSDDNDTSAYLGTSEKEDFGVNRWAITELPTQPLLSLCELQHFDPAFLNYHYPLVSNAIGNSHASPFIASNQFRVSRTNGLDHSYVANHILWDDWFVSSLAPKTENYAVSEDLDTVFGDFLTGEGNLRNLAYRPSELYSEGEAEDVVNAYKDNANSWQDVASELVVEGMFNINSTSVKAWSALLKSHLKSNPVYQEIDPTREGTTPTVEDLGDNVATISRLTLNSDEDSTGGGVHNIITNPQEWDEDMLEALAERIVEQVRQRGPFLSLSEFMNRQLSSNEDGLAVAGAVEAALIELSEGTSNNPYQDFMTEYAGDEFQAQAQSTYAFEEAGEGHVLYGTPGWARQADILRPLAPVLSVRDDTFTIRAYGDARDRSGVKARAWCEAVIVRTADYVDPNNESTDQVDELSELNLQTGRRFKMASFRWLSENEV